MESIIPTPITHLHFPFPFTRQTGKVREIYILKDTLIILIATDRISAFDVILPRMIPHKGQVLTQLATYFLEATRDIVPNYLLLTPDPQMSVGLYCQAVPVEVVVRGHLCGHAWRVYQAGGRTLCGVPLPEGMKENDPFPEPILTPSTKSTIGHDEDISEAEIYKSGLLDPESWEQIKYYAFQLFARGQEMAKQQGLILADTKYEFGYFEGDLHLIDEIHTPDSSRYFYAKDFDSRQAQGQSQLQLSKEFVREWLISEGFSGQAGQLIPEMTDAKVQEISQRYITLYEQVTGKTFVPVDSSDFDSRLQLAANTALSQLGILPV